jgi:surfactin synthase thioesterase subunit
VRTTMTRERAEQWLVGWTSKPGAEVTIVAVPHSLGGPSAFRRWLPLLPPTVDLRVANFPGRERRVMEAPATRLEVLAEEVARAAVSIATPVAIFGHSQGALVAFEAARRVESAGVPLVHVFASGCWAPHKNRPHPGLPAPDADDPEVLASLVAVGGVPPELTGDESMMEMLVRLWRADAMITRRYQFHAGFPPLSAPLTAFGGADDRLFPPDGLDAWARHTNGPFRVRTFPGGHFYLDTERAALIDEILGALPETWRTR